MSGKERKRERGGLSKIIRYLLRKRETKVERVESFDEVGRAEKKEVPFRVGSVVLNITATLAPSQIK